MLNTLTQNTWKKICNATRAVVVALKIGHDHLDDTIWSPLALDKHHAQLVVVIVANSYDGWHIFVIGSATSIQVVL